jgi:hypothetical protein
MRSSSLASSYSKRAVSRSLMHEGQGSLTLIRSYIVALEDTRSRDGSSSKECEMSRMVSSSSSSSEISLWTSSSKNSIEGIREGGREGMRGYLVVGEMDLGREVSSDDRPPRRHGPYAPR